MLWPRLKVFWLSNDDSIGHCERKKKKKVDRRTGVKIILRNGQGWTLLAELRQLKTGLGRRGLWCPNDLARLRDRLD